jgi:lipopolysaccharide biosynthesis glycosyltransferase
VVFVANRAMLTGLCASLGSLATALRGKAHPPIFVFNSDLTNAVQTRLSAALGRINPELFVEFRPVDVAPYLDLLPLQGDHMTYVRLGLPRLLPGFETIMYLDADMVFTDRVVELFDVDLGEKLLAASGVGTAADALESRFYSTIGMQPDTPTFNAGLLLMNSRLWLQNNVEEECLRFGRVHRDECRSADQTILNSLYHAEFMPLPAKFNHYCGPWTKPDCSPAVYHFVGMPKPWDLLGVWLHRFHPLWRAAARDGGYRFFVWELGGLPGKLRRAWIGRRSLARALLKRLRN